MRILLVIIVAAGVAVAAVFAMDYLGAPGASGSTLRSAIAGAVAGIAAVVVAHRGRDKK